MKTVVGLYDYIFRCILPIIGCVGSGGFLFKGKRVPSSGVVGPVGIAQIENSLFDLTKMYFEHFQIVD